MGINILLLAPAGLECWDTSLGRENTTSHVVACCLSQGKQLGFGNLCMLLLQGGVQSLTDVQLMAFMWILGGLGSRGGLPCPQASWGDGRLGLVPRWATVGCRSSHGLQPYGHCFSSILCVPCCLWKCVWKESLQTNPCHCGVIPALLIPGLFRYSCWEVHAPTDQCLVKVPWHWFVVGFLVLGVFFPLGANCHCLIIPRLIHL